MIASFISSRQRRLGLALLLLSVPACGLADYEALMRDAQEREERFREEQEYLGKPAEIPKEKDEKGNEKPVANVFVRLPKGIESKPQQRGDLMWRYPAGRSGSYFLAVDMAFSSADDKDFANKVLSNYESSAQAAHSTRQVLPPGQTTPMTFDVWEFANVSVNILQSKPFAMVFIYNKAQQVSARKAIELALQSLGVDQKAAAARQHYNQKTPWKLEAKPSP